MSRYLLLYPLEDGSEIETSAFSAKTSYVVDRLDEFPTASGQPLGATLLCVEDNSSWTVETVGVWTEQVGGGGDVATDTIWDAVGDLAVGTGANTAAKLTKGTSLQILRVKVDESALEWADPAASAGHTIQDDDVPLTARTGLSFQDGFVLADDAGGNQTEIDLSYEATPSTQAFADAAAGGDAITVTRGNHKHAMPANPVTAHEGAYAHGDIAGHIADGADAHDASAISILDAADDFTATDVEGALAELQSDAETHAAAGDPHAGYRLESADHSHASTGLQAGQITVAALSDAPAGELGGTWASPTVDATHAGSTHSASTDTHIADTSAAHAASAVSADSTTLVGVGTDVQAVLEELDNGIVDHAAAADPHTGYRLESADHTHATTGLQAGQLDHGTALTGLTDDDHTQYRKETDIVEHVSFTYKGNIAVGAGATRWYNDTGRTLTLQSARGSVGTAPATTSILVDVNNNGTSVWNSTQANRITIAAAGNTDEGGAFDDSSIADGEYITVDIDQIGTGTVGADLVVTIWYTS